MAPATAGADAATAGGLLLVLAIVLPVAGVLLALALGGHHAERVALVLMPVGLGIAVAILLGVARGRDSLRYLVGGWRPPLGLALRADGLSAAMLVTTAVVICAAGLFAREDFRTPASTEPEGRGPLVFWVLLLGVWGAVNAVFLAGDLFNLYVALELLTFAAVPMVCLDGRAETLAAALRYLLFALLGSVLYLLGVALLYGSYGTLDIPLLAGRVRVDGATAVAGALITTGLMAKTALFPLHLWLPPAHAGAPPAASAVLSALVVKASFFLIVRVWFEAMPGLLSYAMAQVLAGLGAAAVVLGSVLALRQARLKLLIAYSTVAQIGYLFLMFPLAGGGPVPAAAGAWMGGVLQAVSHAFAKAAMFMAAGLMALSLGHDRIAGLGGVGRHLPMTVFAFGLCGLSLMGLPPSGGFMAKWLLLTAAVDRGQWWWAIVIVTGGMFTGGYIGLVLARALAATSEPWTPSAPVSRHREVVVLALAILSVLLGLVPLGSFDLVQIGRPSLSVGAPR